VPAILAASEEIDESDKDGWPELPEGLYRDPSRELAQSAESVLLAEHTLRRRRLELERYSVEDDFAKRAQREADEKAELRRQAAAAAEQRERDRLTRAKLEECARLLADLQAGESQTEERIFPLGWPLKFSFKVQDACLKLLAKIDPRAVPDEMLNQL